MKTDSDQYSHEETEQRVQAALRGARLAGATPRKAMPKKLTKAQPPRQARKAKA